jgi:hypothetical protein
MSTPVQRPHASTPAVPSTGSGPAAPVPVAAPLGWFLTLAAGIALLLATWVLYPIDYDGMWAGYRDDVIAVVVLLSVMALHTSLPRQPFLGLLGLCGVLLVLFAVFLDNPTRVFVMELTCGIAILVGTGLQAAGSRS